jgi:hypothetical protein
MNCNGQRTNQHQGDLNRTPPNTNADSPGISANTNWTKLLLVGTARIVILQDSVKCVQHIRSEVKLDTLVNSALFCFTKSLVLRNTTNWGTTRLYMQFCQYQVQEFHLYSQIVSKNLFRDWTIKVCEMSGNCGYLVKGPSGWQCVNNY